MTRAHTRQPIWTWHCDSCGRSSGDLAFEQFDLPKQDEMRERGWFIADVWGDECPDCVAITAAAPSTTGQENER